MAAKVTIELSEKQAAVLLDALDLYTRIHRGQLLTVEWTIDLQNVERKGAAYNRQKAWGFLNKAKKIIFPNLKEGESMDITSVLVSERVRVSDDIYHQLQAYVLSEKRGENPVLVTGNSTEGLPKVTISEV